MAGRGAEYLTNKISHYYSVVEGKCYVKLLKNQEKVSMHVRFVCVQV